MKRYLLAIVLLLPFILQAKVAVEKPRSKQPTAFAIVVDQATYDKTAPQIHAYRDVLEADGLSTYILRDNWQTPEQVREQLIALMRKTAKRSPLEGVVFVGDIPIAMVRNAQHLTTAFKMDEDNFPMIQSSVPSDRYYDCPDLQFELIARDTTDRLLSYFNLACDSPQRLDPAFYSGRIRYPEQLGGDKYEGIARYLEKVVAERGKVDQLDNLVTYAGDGYNSDCLVCWMDERVAIDENFPLTDTRKAGNLRQLNFRMDDYMKYRVFDELVRPEVDAMFFNEHGSPDKQHVGSYTTEPDSFDGQYSQLKAEVMIALYMERRKGDKADVEGAKQYFKEKYHLTDAFFETKKTEADDDTKAKGDQTIVSLEDLETLAAQPRFVMLNACYNGSFHKPGYITGYYIFGPGRTVATQGNTVNVLQDRWTYELVGLLSHGVRVGQYNRLIASLEGHIIGDPAFRFQPVEPNTLATDMTTRKGDAAYWRSLLASPWADVQSLALRMLTDAGAISAGELLEFMKQSPLATTRMECLKLIGRFGDEEIFSQAIIRGLKDRYELLRRNAATYAWQSSRLELLPALADTYVNDSESKRVAYIVMKGLELFPEKEVEQALRTAVEASPYADSEAKFTELWEEVAGEQAMKERQRNQLFNGKTLKSRISAIRSMRNNTYHELVPELLKLVADASQPLELRVNTAECLGWFAHTPRRAEIIDACRQAAADKNLEKELRDELTQTAIRLESTVSVPTR